MLVVTCQIASWDKPIEVTKFSGDRMPPQNEFQIGEEVIIKTEQGADLAKIVKLEERPNHSEKEQESLNILIRKATPIDTEKLTKKREARAQTLEECEKLIKQRRLPMKLIDVIFHFDGGRMTFAFSASSKVDFRELVQDLAKKFHKSIRLYQVGARQEVEIAGDVGHCGQRLCCLSFLKRLGNVTTELIFDQQVAHRGVDRLSGVCGRLKCCLLYEEENYKALTENLPAIGTAVKTSRGEGRVLSWHILKQTVMVEIDKETVIEIPVAEIKR